MNLKIVGMTKLTVSIYCITIYLFLFGRNTIDIYYQPWHDILSTYKSLFICKKKYFQDLLSQYFFFCQINLNNIFSSDNLLFWVSVD